MPSFDLSLLQLINGQAGVVPAWDAFVILLAENQLLKGGPFLAACWWAWFRKAPETQHSTRACILATLIAACVAVSLARVLAVTLPFRLRPLHDPSSGVRVPLGLENHVLGHWSSMPSDHATLYFCLACGLSVAWTRLAWWLLPYVILVVALPRIYLGLHYPSDMAAGAILGLACAFLATAPAVRERLTRPLLKWEERRPGSFYAVFFIITFQMATLFDGARQIVGYLRHL